MGWFVALLLAMSGAGLWAWQHRRFARNWRHVQEILGDLIAAREPRSFVFSSGARFRELSEQLQKLADEQDRLRRWRSREEANLQAILVSMGEGVLVADGQHIIRLTNPAFMRILGLSFDPVGRTVMQALSEPQIEEVVSAVLAQDQPQHREVTLEQARALRHIAIAATPMRDVSGLPAVVMIVHDVTRLKQLEDVRREFVANVSHELRTPLAIFQGYVETLLDNPGLPRAQLVEVLEILQRHSTRLNLLVEDLLILARLESRSDTLKLEPIATGLFLQQMASDWKLRIREKEITLTVEVSLERGVFWADRFRLEQVLNNLIDNAVKYGERRGHVVLSAKVERDELELSVQDDGPGISAADLPHIFERFFRVDKARSGEQSGTGLGLSIVKHIVHLHGGSVKAQSNGERGTRIILRLPLQPTAPTAERRTITEPLITAQ